MTKANAGTGDSGLSRIEALERLGRLRADGLLSEEEFVREKARILAGAYSTGSASSTEAVPGPASTAGATGSAAAAIPDDNDLLAPIRPIANDQYAAFLVTKVWAGVAALICVEAVSVIARVIQLLDGRGWATSVSVPTGLALSAGYFLLAGLILWGLGRWVSRRSSRVGAVVLIVLALGALTNAVLRPGTDGLWLKVGGFALSAFALWFLMGAARGAFALGGRRAPAEPAQGKQSAREAWSQGRKAAAPIRKIMGWIALGWLGLFLIGGVWFWWSMRGDGPMPPQPAAMTSPAGAPSHSPPPAVTSAPALTPTRQMLVGVWSPDPNACVGWGTYVLSEDGRATADAADGQWGLTLSTLVLQLRTYDMDTDLPGPVEDLGGFIEMIGTDAFRLTRGSETTTYYRCSSNG